jgi:putative chitinase
MDRSIFFNVIREEFGALSQSQVEGTEFLLDEGERRSTGLGHLAYILATAVHETASTMQPIAEYGKGQGHEYGEPLPEYDNQCAYGRGYVQLTWAENYERADKECSLNGALLEDFELALDGPTAAEIIFEGMSAGWFTGKKLSDYINDTQTDYWNARRIVNGTDKADLIEGYAFTYEKALMDARYGEPEPVDPDEITTPPETAEHPPLPPHPPHPDRVSPQYEYVIEDYDAETVAHHMKLMGLKGWRLAHFTDSKLVWETVK